jgi:hypothetical protein
MRCMDAWKSLRRSWQAVLLAAPLAYGLAVGGQSVPASAEEGLHVGSPPAVLNDPIVQKCRLLAARRTNPNVNPMSTAVEEASYQFKLEPVFDAVATCRAALARYPNEPKVIIAHYNASDTLSAMVFGLKFPDSEEEALALALAPGQMPVEPSGGGMLGQLLTFYIGSAYEYGVGTKPDRSAAMKWYAIAAAAGDAISKRELARLQGNKP